jgi:glycosyltransferase involved in cell wall biosynthesis
MRILFLSASLESGGAERQLVALARGLRRGGHETAVAVLYGGGPFADDLRGAGVPLHALGRRSRWDLRFLPRLARLVRSERPDAILTYLGGPNVFAAISKPLFPSVKVVWGLRSAMHELPAAPRGDWLRAIAPRVESLVSGLADAIVANSHAARSEAMARGMDGAKIFVVPNGIDCAFFRPDAAGRARVRAEWGIPERAPLVGMVARLDPVKNHAAFLAAAAMVAAARADARFVCVGRGEGPYRGELARMAQGLGLADRLTWAGERSVTSAVHSALDVAVLSSDSESFPNAVAEAMACGTPVVATDTGDLALLVGDTGVVVPRRDPAALASGILRTLDRLDAGDQLRGRTRERIEREYSVELLVARTERTLREVVGGRR